MKRIELNGFHLISTILFFLAIIIFKLFNSSYLSVNLITSFYELISILFLILVIGFILPKFSKTRFFIVLTLQAISFFLYFIQGYFLSEAVYRKDTLKFQDIEVMKYFFQNILPLKVLILIIFLIGLIYFISYFFQNRSLFLSYKVSMISFLLIVFFLFVAPLFSSNFTNPYYNTFINNNQVTLFSKLNWEASSNVSIEYENFYFTGNNSQENFSLDKEKYIIFILESVDNEEFYSVESKLNFEESFYKQIKSNSRFYENYYTTNQDSKTSVMSILSSTFIPYEAYRHDWFEVYGKEIYQQDNLVNFFKRNNYSTYYLHSSTQVPEFIPDYDFETEILIDEERYQNYKSSKENLCLEVVWNQKGCEDNVLFEELIEVISKNESQFIVQEFVFGHGTEYYKQKDMDGYEYYNQYLLRFYDELERRGIEDKVRIAVVSDHGSRHWNNIRTKKGYNVPLIIYDEDFHEEKNNDLYNHQDFSELFLGLKKKPREEIFVVGPTSKNILFYLNKSEEYAFFNFNLEPHIFLKSSDFDRNNSQSIFDKFMNYRRFYFGH